MLTAAAGAREGSGVGSVVFVGLVLVSAAVRVSRASAGARGDIY
jgi:hypothetical protein|eukprot:SAG25_NODE_1138_length_3816_cov_4.312887_2_plen_44_part_00